METTKPKSCCSSSIANEQPKRAKTLTHLFGDKLKAMNLDPWTIVVTFLMFEERVSLRLVSKAIEKMIPDKFLYYSIDFGTNQKSSIMEAVNFFESKITSNQIQHVTQFAIRTERMLGFAGLHLLEKYVNLQVISLTAKCYNDASNSAALFHELWIFTGRLKRLKVLALPSVVFNPRIDGKRHQKLERGFMLKIKKTSAVGDAAEFGYCSYARTVTLEKGCNVRANTRLVQCKEDITFAKRPFPCLECHRRWMLTTALRVLEENYPVFLRKYSICCCTRSGKHAWVSFFDLNNKSNKQLTHLNPHCDLFQKRIKLILPNVKLSQDSVELALLILKFNPMGNYNSMLRLVDGIQSVSQTTQSKIKEAILLKMLEHND